ncbi:Aspartate carbamoyltransferase [[Clostridium] cellulosi]|uniref:Aspartate carbamoyltransferase n=1 Tax=[Clostridium] cellulosi TaxID=29343 RepID=A0A078KR96_9FIRM|nr:MAG: aspartate carbamoyltransferase [[Clostridium] cellulosi]CDZ23690.1 Aspartate carbamoyltransferase [[Clostridium] cellulosi]
MALSHLIDLNDCTTSEWDELIRLAADIRMNPEDYLSRCRGKIMATLFYEPSTRTQMSFQAAMLRLGGQIIGFDNPINSSVAKGESLKDTIKIVSGYSDILVMRHPIEGAAKAASLYSNCPIINAGDGGHLHPTQTLTDLVTLSIEKDGLTGHTIGLCGDLRYGRTVHSLIKAMCKIGGNRFILISTPELTVPQYIKDVMDRSGCEYTEVNTLEECIGDLDVLYMTRIQRERFATPEEYEQQRGIYILDREKMKKAKKDLVVMHPLPRVDEIENEIDNDRRAAYFRQAVNGMYVRMALILKMIENNLKIEDTPKILDNNHTCHNPRCITQQEHYLPHYFKKDAAGNLACIYCDDKQR